MRRRVSPRRSSSRWIWWAGGVLLLVALVFVLALPALVTGWLQRYVRGSDFHQVAAQLIESRIGGRADLSPLAWHDDMATMSAASVESASGWRLEGTELRAAVNFGAIRRGAWHIQSASADELVLTKAGAAAAETTGVFEATKVNLPGWIDRYIPKTTEVDGFDVERFHFTQGAWQIAASRLHLGSYNSATTSAGRFSLPGGLEGGTLKTPLMPPNQQEPLKLDIQRAAFRVTEDKLALTDSVLRWKERTSVTMHGSVRFRSGEWQAVVDVKEAPVGEFLTAEWHPRLSGKLEGKVELSGSRDRPASWTADTVLKDGVLTALPVLDKLATYTRMERFKRLALDVVTATVRPHAGGGTRLEKIVVQANGLLRIEGALTLLPGDALEGDFMLGVTPETLRWLPGAENRVFVETYPQGPPGMNWTRVKIAGTRAAPQEDLSARLLGAAGMSLLLDTPGTIVNQAADTLIKPVLGTDAAKLPGQIIDTTTKTLENGVKTGTDLINKVIPVFPGK